MGRLCACLVLTASLAALAQDRSRPVVITGVAVLTMTPGATEPQQSQTVVIEHGRIAAIGPAAAAAAPEGAAVLDGRGRFLIPGLWDMHIHAGGYEQGRRTLGMLLAAGVTSARDMGTPLDDAIRLRQGTASGEIPGPRLFVAGPVIQGPLPFAHPMLLALQSPGDAAAAIDRLAAAGVDFAKVHDALTADIYQAVIERARTRRLPVAGHIPPAITARAAAAAGQRSIEHLGGRFHGVLLGCSNAEEELTRQVREVVAADLAALAAGREPDEGAILRASLTRPLVESFDAAKADALFATFARSGTWHTPTLTGQPISALLRETPRLDAAEREAAARLQALQREVVRRMHRAGVGLLAGTDGPPGGSITVHDELSALAGAGLTPLEALRTATSAAARFAGVTDAGTIEVGKRADLVLLAANPAERIEHARQIDVVFAGGRLVYQRPRP